MNAESLLTNFQINALGPILVSKVLHSHISLGSKGWLARQTFLQCKFAVVPSCAPLHDASKMLLVLDSKGVANLQGFAPLLAKASEVSGASRRVPTAVLR